jgi:hypothetical protein
LVERQRHWMVMWLLQRRRQPAQPRRSDPLRMTGSTATGWPASPELGGRPGGTAAPTPVIWTSPTWWSLMGQSQWARSPRPMSALLEGLPPPPRPAGELTPTWWCLMIFRGWIGKACDGSRISPGMEWRKT